MQKHKVYAGRHPVEPETPIGRNKGWRVYAFSTREARNQFIDKVLFTRKFTRAEMEKAIGIKNQLVPCEKYGCFEVVSL